MARPEVGTVGEGLYDSLRPLAWDDENQSWALLIFLGGMGHMFQFVNDLVSDDGDAPGWSAMLDIDRCPGPLLPFLGLFVGVWVPPGTGEDEARDLVREKAGQTRGRPGSMEKAMKKTLTGTKTVRLYERVDDNAYLGLAVTKPSETPDPEATLAAMRSQKPGGIKMTYDVSDLLLIDELAGTIDALPGAIQDLSASGFILDTFDRADEAPIDNGTWDGPLVTGEGTLDVVSDALRAGGSNASGWWTPDTFGPDAEVFAVDLQGSASTVGLYVRLSDVGGGAPSGYHLRIVRGGSTTWTIRRLDAGVYTVLETVVHAVPVTRLRLRVIGGHLVALSDDDVILEADDSTYADPGYVGAFASGVGAALDDFGASTI